LKSVHQIEQNMVLHRQLGRAIGICGKGWPFASENMDHAGKENKSLSKFNKELSQWIHGPIIARGHNGSIVPLGADGKVSVPWRDQVYDLEPIDFRHIVDQMRGEHYRSDREFKVYTEGSLETVKGVRMNCTCDNLICTREMTEAVDVAKSLCAEELDIDAAIAEKVDVPLVIRKIPYPIYWRGREHSGLPCATNPGPMYLDIQRQYDAMREELRRGVPPPVWAPLGGMRGDLGSCVAVRTDGKTLEPACIEALQIYARQKIGTAIKSSIDPGAWPEDILAEVSKQEWDAYYADFVSKGDSLPGFVFGVV
jgi:hypothetical protein